jgi:hypothetical protein
MNIIFAPPSFLTRKDWRKNVGTLQDKFWKF